MNRQWMVEDEAYCIAARLSPEEGDHKLEEATRAITRLVRS